MDEEQIKKKFSRFLNEQRLRMSALDREIISQSEMSRRIDVAQGSLNQWIRGTRLPTGDNVTKLAAAFGVKVYDILELPRSMPDNRYLKQIAEVWTDLPEDSQRRWSDQIMDDAELWNEKAQSYLKGSPSTG